MAVYNKILNKSRNKAEIYLNMGMLCRINGALDNALNFYQKVIDQGDKKISERAYRERSKIFTETGRKDLAAREFQKAKQLYK